MGAIPMEDMDLVISPKEQKLVVNPAHPNFPVTVAKGFRVSAIPMEDMDVLIHPAKQELVVHPDHPYLAQFAMRGFE
jgi:hypothetical protein